MNLFWDLPGRFVEVGVTLTILDEPRTDDLYFWALQVGFEDDASGRREGAAEELGISERTLYKKIKEYDIDE